MPYLVIGDPSFAQSRKLATALLAGGADMLEFGLAFSDPPADGPVIQAAGKRALAAGADTDRAFDYLTSVRAETTAPIALLVYYNLVLNTGVRNFYARAHRAGVDAILVADLPLEESAEAIAAATDHDIAPISIISELTTRARLEQLAKLGRGYLYLVARLGVTGQRDQLGADLTGLIARVREVTALPLLAGFGLSSPRHVREVIDGGADGAISGSAVVQRIADNLRDETRMLTEIERFAREMKEATRPGPRRSVTRC